MTTAACLWGSPCAIALAEERSQPHLAKAPLDYPIFVASPDERHSVIGVRVDPLESPAIAVLRHQGPKRTVTQLLPSDSFRQAGFLDDSLLWNTCGKHLSLYDIATRKRVKLQGSPRDLLLAPDGSRLLAVDWSARQLLVLRRDTLGDELVVKLPPTWEKEEVFAQSLRWIVPHQLVLVARLGGFGIIDLKRGAVTQEATAVDALILPEPVGKLALLARGSVPWSWTVSVLDAQSGKMSDGVTFRGNQPELRAVEGSSRFIALYLVGDPTMAPSPAMIQLFDSKSGERLGTVEGPEVDWGGFINIGLTEDNVLCASHSYRMRGGTCEATPLFDLKTLSVAKLRPGERCIVRGEKALRARVGAPAAGRAAIPSGGNWGFFGDVCNQALSKNGRLFAQVESTPLTHPTEEELWSALGRDPHLVVFDARTGKRKADIKLPRPPESHSNSLWLEFVKDTVVDVSTAYEVTWRVDLSTGRIIQGPGFMPAQRSPSGRWGLGESLFDFRLGRSISWPWWTDVAKGVFVGYPEEFCQ